jgi:AcrR family transcriptional regulator
MKEQPAVNATRRRPAQSRALVTAEAIQQAFVQLLVEHGYSNVSIRQVTTAAGVGIGSFYEYFASKEALAAVCIHLRIKRIADDMRECISTTHDKPLPECVDALLIAQTRAPLSEPEQWSALFLLERQVSGIDAYRKLYAEFVQLWTGMLESMPDWPADAPAQEAAFAVHAMIYGLVSQRLMTCTAPCDPTALLRLLRTAVHGYLSLIVPRAYRLYRFDF